MHAGSKEHLFSSLQGFKHTNKVCAPTTPPSLSCHITPIACDRDFYPGKPPTRRPASRVIFTRLDRLTLALAGRSCHCASPCRDMWWSGTQECPNHVVLYNTMVGVPPLPRSHCLLGHAWEERKDSIQYQTQRLKVDNRPPSFVGCLKKRSYNRKLLTVGRTQTLPLKGFC